ncbi:MAG TPA: hypothetical protein VEV17_07855 [Bryobacteraceae bacterium]|nr:hypothetical protein [Bryobacteraceae bacterium]
MKLLSKLASAVLAVACASIPARSQDDAAQKSGAPQQPAEQSSPRVIDPQGFQPGEAQAPPDKRAFAILPNYGTVNESTVYIPITRKQKFIIASKDSFDYPLALFAGGIAGLGQLTNENPSFGQGLAGYSRRLGSAYGDQAIGTMLTEGLFPTLLREDPRYFRRGRGGVWSRTYYAMTRAFATRTDSGGRSFNFSEVLGSAALVAISVSYYPDERTVSDSAAKLGEQMAIDSVSQVLKEFWPDIKRRFFQRPRDGGAASH